jgi:hypothetical protein
MSVRAQFNLFLSLPQRSARACAFSNQAKRGSDLTLKLEVLRHAETRVVLPSVLHLPAALEI